MREQQRIFPVRRTYNKFVADQTLEDYSLRYTAEAARRFTPWRVANTALGAISFLACEALGGGVTLMFGFTNAMAAILAVGALIFLASLPIGHYAAKYGVDMDLLTRGAGFGYIGSTVTSLIYACFTFILFAIEATIMADALQMCLGVPLGLAYAISSLAILPIAALGIRFISRYQLWTQPIWLVLQIAPFAYSIVVGAPAISGWMSFPGAAGALDGSFDLRLFGLSASILLSLLPQIGEQVDYLRFLPTTARIGARSWRFALFAAGPGWVLIGVAKLAAGSFLAYQALSLGVSPERAAQPSEIYYLAFSSLVHSPGLALALTGLFVVVCQTKINVTNAYAGSIAWSNFFSRITHNHPGRVVWLVFNVTLALLLMEFGVSHVIDSILAFYSNFAVAWIGALTADLVVDKPLGLSPPQIEFRRAYLYDVNPVGCGAMLGSLIVSTAALYGLLGDTLQPLSALIGFVVAFSLAPLIAYATGGRYYIARPQTVFREPMRCMICENEFEPHDMASCPAYGAAICSLCCSLDMRCKDACKPQARLAAQARALFSALLPRFSLPFFSTRAGRFLVVLGLLAVTSAAILGAIYFQYAAVVGPSARPIIRTTLEIVFVGLLLVMGVAAWTLVLAQESRRVAEEETRRQTEILQEEITAHERTDAELQRAKEAAEAANIAKTRFIAGLNHEIRTPLNAINGYAQLLERDATDRPQDAVRVIRRSTEHITNLIDGLLDVAKIETGSLDVARDIFRIDETLDQLVDMFRLQAAAKGVAFRYERSPDLPRYVRTDRKRLRQILINLVSNAVKFTERGHAGLKVSYRNDIAEFIVEDTGIGIMPEDMQRIFAPFERGRMAAVSAIPGTGLGLTITKLLTQIIGGEMRVESEVGRGSRFVVRLYLTAATSPEEGQQPPQIRGYAGARKTILVADDTATHIDVMRQSLGGLGFDVLTASNGADCVALAIERNPDLVMLDIAMPGMDGWEAARRLRDALGPETPIMMVSANAHELMERRGPDSPHDDFLVKPIEFSEMLDRIGNLLGLDWFYVAARATPGAEPFAPAALALPRESVEKLLHLCRVGHSRGIEAALREIEAAAPERAAAIAQLRAMAQNFEFEELAQTLEAALTQEVEHVG
ncbi:hybrid sensor histidine kinase/response regulator [Methylosinus sp. C49]|uniref:hybrid sensor histidine kinase/response regulator n=1 Tax=Methylosinus sp. C49 TaxID=2699395 RepID=UPI0013678BF4|nr:ATP-binding protein [Methylosinus sp. C49]BBU62746.1 hybrid sensor histidine kinase/response regulator [Methylosinus sp. C49]